MLYTAHLENIQDRNLHPLPFIAAGPGTGKTRMLIESLNTLQQCAKEEDNVDLRELVNNAVLINVTYGNSTAADPIDIEIGGIASLS